MKWFVITAVMMCAMLPHPVDAGAWTLWIRYDASSTTHANRGADVTRRWERGATATTYDQCIADKRRVWEGVTRRYADLSHHPAIETMDSISEQAVFLTLRKRDGLLDGHQHQHFSCLADGLDPR